MQQTMRETKTVRFEARITEEQKTLFLQAAALAGHHTLTDFIITSAQERALLLVKEYNVLQLSRQDRDIFMDALLNPPAPNQKLRAAAQQYATLNNQTVANYPLTELLDRRHARKTFSCSEPTLDTHLRRYASQDQKRRVAAVFVAADEDGSIRGCYTLSMQTIAQLF